MLSIVGVVSPKRRSRLSQTVTLCSILDGEQDGAHIGVQGTHAMCSHHQLPLLTTQDFVSKECTPHYAGQEIMCYSCSSSNEKARV